MTTLSMECGMQARASKIVILYYFLSKLYPINYCKNIHNINVAC